MAYSTASRIVAVSEGVSRELVCRFGVVRDKIEVIHNPVVTKEYLLQGAQPVPHDWLAQDVPVIVAAGRFTPEKDFHTLLRAFSRLRSQQRVRLIVLGDGPLRDELKKLSVDMKIDDDVAFLGHVDDPGAYFSRASLFVLSSAFEGFGNVLVEAMVFGTPVVSTDSGGPSEILEGGRWGRLVPVGAVDALADAMALTLGTSERFDVAHRAADFGADHAVSSYLRALSIDPVGS